MVLKTKRANTRPPAAVSSGDGRYSTFEVTSQTDGVYIEDRTE